MAKTPKPSTRETSGITLDNGIKKPSGITLDNGLKQGTKVDTDGKPKGK